jgi:hypothetical protein
MVRYLRAATVVLANLATGVTYAADAGNAVTLSCSGTRQAFGNGVKTEMVTGFVIVVYWDEGMVMPVGYNGIAGQVLNPADVPPLVVTSKQAGSFEARSFFYQSPSAMGLPGRPNNLTLMETRLTSHWPGGKTTITTGDLSGIQDPTKPAVDALIYTKFELACQVADR